jgi:uncharacterized membrane protein YhdT
MKKNKTKRHKQHWAQETERRQTKQRDTNNIGHKKQNEEKQNKETQTTLCNKKQVSLFCLSSFCFLCPMLFVSLCFVFRRSVSCAQERRQTKQRDTNNIVQQETERRQTKQRDTINIGQQETEQRQTKQRDTNNIGHKKQLFCLSSFCFLCPMLFVSLCFVCLRSVSCAQCCLCLWAQETE